MYRIEFEHLTGANGAVAEIEQKLAQAYDENVTIWRIFASPSSVNEIVAAVLRNVGQSPEFSELADPGIQLHYRDKWTDRKIPVVRTVAVDDRILLLTTCQSDEESLAARPELFPALAPKAGQAAPPVFPIGAKRKIRLEWD